MKNIFGSGWVRSGVQPFFCILYCMFSSTCNQSVSCQYSQPIDRPQTCLPRLSGGVSDLVLSGLLEVNLKWTTDSPFLKKPPPMWGGAGGHGNQEKALMVFGVG
jgi:hypothetical protein